MHGGEHGVRDGVQEEGRAGRGRRNEGEEVGRGRAWHEGGSE